MTIYNEGLNDFVHFAETQADYLNEVPKQQFITYKTKEIKQRIEMEHKREAFVRKSANKLYALALKEMKRELKLKRKKHRQEMLKFGVLAKLHEHTVLPTEQIIDCNNCEHCFMNDSNNLCCEVYNLEFQSDAMRQAFCTCYCTAYKQIIATIDQDEAEEVKEVVDDNTSDDEDTQDEKQTPQETADDEPTCCRECGAYIDSDDGCFCNKYGKYLNDCDVNSICCCESDDFFDDEENNDE